MHAHRPPSDRPAPPEPLRADEIHRMLEAERERRPAEPAPKPRFRRRLIQFAVLFLLYVLSIGPMYWKWFGAKSGLASPIYLVLYRPLERLADLSPPLGHFLNWYVSLWIF